jgi:FkbM family methyltransferase
MVGGKSFQRTLERLRIPRRLRRTQPSEARRRRAFAEEAASFTPYVAVESDGDETERTVIFLPTRQKAGVDRFTKPEWKERRHLQRALDTLSHVGLQVPKTMFVDVGAHIGTSTITAVRRFGFDAAFAVEPEAENFRFLRANLAVNGLETRVHTVKTAISNRVGTAELKLRPTMGSKHRLLGRGETAPNTVRVPVTTLDTLVDEGSLDPAEISLLWLDIEGHELEVLQGARTLRERSVPIVMEFVPRRLHGDERLEALHSLLRGHYTHVFDLRRSPDERPDIRPLDALVELAEEYRQGFTDLLVLRHPCAPRLAA